jgi:predicted nucleotidyltransferase
MSNGLSDKDLRTIVRIIECSGVVEVAVLYGSRALGTFRNGSDVDIALKGRKLTQDVCSDIHFKLEEETILPYFFDVTNYETINNEKLKEHIDRVGKVIYCKTDTNKGKGVSNE